MAKKRNKRTVKSCKTTTHRCEKTTDAVAADVCINTGRTGGLGCPVCVQPRRAQTILVYVCAATTAESAQQLDEDEYGREGVVSNKYTLSLSYH